MRKRDNRFLKDNHYYHIVNRGNHRDIVFHDDEDYIFALYHLNRMIRKYDQILIFYCLMPTHYHFLFKTRKKQDFIRMMQQFGSGLARYYNKKYSTVGHLFQDKYKHNSICSIEALIIVSNYIHLNPLELDDYSIDNLIQYPWSSIYEFEKKEESRYFKPSEVLQYFDSFDSYIKGLDRNVLV